MDFNALIRPLLKWWWLIAIATVLAAVSSYLVTRQQPPLYQSRTTLVIGRAVYESNPSTGDFNLNAQLSEFYADLAMREPVRNATMKALDMSWLPEFVVRPLQGSQLLEILVTDTNPQRAQAVANELANQLIRQTPTDDQDEQQQQAFINEQLVELELKIKETSNEISNKQAELADLFSAREIAQTQTEIVALEEKLSDLRSNYASLLANSNREAANTLGIIEPANLPRRPVGPRTGMMVLLSAAVAFVISAGAAFLLDYLDDTLKSPEEVTQLLDLPVIGLVSEIEDNQNYGAYVAKHPRSNVAESFRSIRTDLEFASVDEPLKTIYITSTGVSEGKTSTAANLAVILAQGGKNVVLLDADLRRPNVHRILGMTNDKGLSDVFRSKYDIYEVSSNWRDGNIVVVTSGVEPSNPSELLSSKKMDHILASLGTVADVVVIDGPPLLVTDATILANKVDGVLLVVRYGVTRRRVAREAIKRLGRTDAKILGVVMNRVPRGAEDYYSMYSYYHEYQQDEEEDIVRSKDGRPRLSLPKLFNRKRSSSMEVAGMEEGEG